MASTSAPCSLRPVRCLAPAPKPPATLVCGNTTSTGLGRRHTGQSLSSSRTGTSPEAGRPLSVAVEGVATSTAEAPSKLLDVRVESEIGQSYDVLQDLLARGQWESADKETRRLICVLAGEGAAKRKWVYFTEVQFMPTADLATIDRLWRAYSDDRFGYSVQRRIWKALGQKWKPFFLKIDWTHGENSFYRKFPMDFTWEAEAPKGHLPLTNCLRGTQLFEALLKHPAFDTFDDEQAMPSDSELPDFSKEAMEASSSAPVSPPKGLTGSIFDEDFNSSDYGF